MAETRQEEARRTTTGDARRRLLVMRAGGRLFAVYKDEVEATGEGLKPTPLPFAPAPVRGVVSQRGRILTLIDPLLLLLPPEASPSSPPPAVRTDAPFIVALKGDEQLALAVECIEQDFELYEDERDDEPDEARNDARAEGHEAARANTSNRPRVLRRILRHRAETIALLDTAHLFEAAMQGVERRRRRQ